MKDAVVVTGAGLVCALGSDLDEAWRAFRSGRSGVRFVEALRDRPLKRWAAPAPETAAEELEAPDGANRLGNPQAMWLTRAAREAYLRAGLDRAAIAGEETGLFMGMGSPGWEAEDMAAAVTQSLDDRGRVDSHRFFRRGLREISPLWLLGRLNNMALCQTAIHLGIKGENGVFAPHADAGVLAVLQGIRAMEAGRAAAVLAGGVSSVIHPNGSWIFEAIQEDPPPNPSSIPGEGCGVLVLEPSSSARKRGASFHAVVSGCGFAFGAHGEGERDPRRQAFTRAMGEALDRAGLDPGDIDLVLPHAEPATEGDVREAQALEEVFGKKSPLANFP